MSSFDLNYNKDNEYEGIKSLFDTTTKTDPLLVKQLSENISKLKTKKTAKKLAEQYGLTWDDVKKKKLYSIKNFEEYIKNRKSEKLNYFRSNDGKTTILIDKNDKTKEIVDRIRQLTDYEGKNINVSVSRPTEHEGELKNFEYIKKTSLDNVEGFGKLITGFFSQYKEMEYGYITIDLADVDKPNTDNFQAKDSNDHYNCAMKIVSKSLNIDFPDFFKNYPKFDGTNDKKTPPIKLIEFEKVCKTEGVRVLLYSKLGQLINKPFRVINKLKSNYSVNVDIILHNGHAYQKFNDSQKIDLCYYTDDPLTELSNYMDNQIINYKKGKFIKYIDIDSKTCIIKNFKPSFYTGDINDDNNVDYFNSFSVESFYFKKWVNENNFKCINSSFVEDIIKQGCHTIGCYSFDLPLPINKNKLLEIDHNRSYSIYRCKKNKFYCGIPLSNIEIYKYDNTIDLNANNVAFIIPNSIKLPNYLFPVGKLFKCLSRPMYKFLISIGAEIDIQAVCFADFVDIKDQPYAKHNGNNINYKFMHNTHVGKLIQGGISQEQCVEITDFNQDEEKLIKYELNKYDIPFDMPNGTNTITCKLPYKKQYYHVYSYIIQYSQIAIISKMLELQKLGCTIYGGNCDSIIFEYSLTNCKLVDYYQDDDFKLAKLNEKTNKYKRMFETNEKRMPNYQFLKIDNLADKPKIIASKLIVNGCAGSGKSYEFIKKSDPRFTIILSPTLQRMRENSNLNNNSTTIQKIIKNPYNKLDVTKIIIDEFLMMDLEELNVLRNYVNKFGISLVMLGHHCQLSKSFGNSEPIKITELDDFIIHNFERGPISRQKCPKLIELLDSFTWGLSDTPNLGVMKEKLTEFQNINYEEFTKQILDSERPDHFILNCVFISEKHDHINYLNGQFKPFLKTIPCVIQKGSRDELGKIINVGIDDSDIDWSRMSMHDAKESKYEPRLIRTVYGMQGDTLEEGKKLVVFKNYITTCNSLYTAITRIRTKEQLIIICDDNEIIKPTREERLRRYNESKVNHNVGTRKSNRSNYEESKKDIIKEQKIKEKRKQEDDFISYIMGEYFEDEFINRVLSNN